MSRRREFLKTLGAGVVTGFPAIVPWLAMPSWNAATARKLGRRLNSSDLLLIRLVRHPAPTRRSPGDSFHFRGE